MKKKNFYIAFLCAVLPSLQTLSSQERYAGGIIIGLPTALSFQIRYPSANSVDFLLATNLKENLFLQCHYDYNITTVTKDKEGIYSINFYAGPGLFLKSSSKKNAVLGISGNVGVAWIFKNQYEFFLEYSPKINTGSVATFDLTGGFGFRYLF